MLLVSSGVIFHVVALGGFLFVCVGLVLCFGLLGLFLLLFLRFFITLCCVFYRGFVMSLLINSNFVQLLRICVMGWFGVFVLWFCCKGVVIIR